MTAMTINGNDIAVWGAKLLDFSVSPYKMTSYTTSGDGSLYPILLSTTLDPLTLSITLDVYGGSMSEAEMTASNILRELSGVSEIGGPDDFLYRCILTGASRSRTVDWIVTLGLTFEAVRHKPMVSAIPEAGSGMVYCESNVETPCILRARTTAEETMLISGDCFGEIEIAYTGSLVIIDGIHKTVTLSNGDNCFLQTTLTRFPSLKPGQNTILAGSTHTHINIRYYPTFL